METVSIDRPQTFVITGASSGLGLAIADELRAQLGHPWLCGVALEECPDWLSRSYQCDLTSYKAISFMAGSLAADLPNGLDVLINCAGINHISYLENTTVDDWDRVMNTNLRAPWQLTRDFLPLLAKRKGTVLNIVSNASHMPMTASSAYNCSKAGLALLTRQLARELTKRYGITVFGLSPNKMAGTGMSDYIERAVPQVRGWTPEYARQYQANALLTGQETSPSAVAGFIGYLLRDWANHRALSGCVLEYGA